MNIEQELGRKLKTAVKANEPMANHTSWQVGGPADYYLCPGGLEEVVEIVRFSSRSNLPLYIMGNGTNLLVLDGGIRGLVVNISDAFCYIRSHGTMLEVGAGTPMTHVAKTASELGLVGIEFAAGIPGSLGGAVIMNAGAFGGYIGERVYSVKLITRAGDIEIKKRNQLRFGYRTCNLLNKGAIVEITLKLKKGDREESIRLVEHYLSERKRRHPDQPSAGSVFRNLPDQPAGRLIESAGGKGLQIGGAQVSEKHANFIINTGNATASDILALIEKVRQLVKDKHGIELLPEVKIVGEES
jgi:UDP-N-acetylmuramate dehydrogenase